MSLAKRIYAVLRESPLPVNTPSLILICAPDLPHARARVWNELRKMQRLRMVRGERGRGLNNVPATLWSVVRQG